MALVDVDRAQTDTIEVGSRCWVFHSRDATSVTVFGEWPSGSVSVDPGWNIVGFGVTQAVPPGAIARAQNGDRHETVDVLEESRRLLDLQRTTPDHLPVACQAVGADSTTLYFSDEAGLL